MWVLFEVIKGFFFFLSMVIGLLFLRGEQILGNAYPNIKGFLMPGYLILIGLMIGYVVAHIWLAAKEDEQGNKTGIYIKSFLIGIVFGIILALVYIFM